MIWSQDLSSYHDVCQVFYEVKYNGFLFGFRRIRQRYYEEIRYHIGLLSKRNYTNGPLIFLGALRPEISSNSIENTNTFRLD